MNWDPNENHDVISLVKQADGNWKGWMWKHDQLLEVRDIDPNTVLLRLLTHS